MSTMEEFEARHDPPPVLLVNRKATVQLGKTNTLRFPGDLAEDDLSTKKSQWFDTSSGGVDAWFDTAEKRDLAPETPHVVHEGNRARFFIDGAEALTAMESAIQRAGMIEEKGTPPDFVYMLNWWADPILTLPSGRRLGELLSDIASDDPAPSVQIRGIFWKICIDPLINDVTFGATTVGMLLPPWFLGGVHDWLPHGSVQYNKAMVDFINEGRCVVDDTTYNPDGEDVVLEHRDGDGKLAPVGAAIHDDRLIEMHVPFAISVGSHHQKVLCVKAAGKLTTFLGGIDFNRDRVEMLRFTFAGAPLHDTHLELRGPAAGDVLRTFVDRWHDHPDGAVQDQAAGELIAGADDLTQPVDEKGRHIVQIGRTFGARRLLGAPAGKENYEFAQKGEQTARMLILKAILAARKYIYIEDQYFINEEAGTALRKALASNASIAHVTIVLPHHALSDTPYSVRHRHAILKDLRTAYPDRIRVFYACGPNQEPGDYHTYVHSKMTVIDDEFAIVGTVNYTRRSWSHDSEICAGIYDPSRNTVLTSRFARWLRMRHWAHHLFGTIVPPTPLDQPPELSDQHYAELWDGVAAGALWVRLANLRERYFRINPLPPPFVPGMTHKRDYGYDQSDPRRLDGLVVSDVPMRSGEPLAATAAVRPYELGREPAGWGTDEPEERWIGGPVLGPTLAWTWDLFLDPDGGWAEPSS